MASCQAAAAFNFWSKIAFFAGKSSSSSSRKSKWASKISAVWASVCFFAVSRSALSLSTSLFDASLNDSHSSEGLVIKCVGMLGRTGRKICTGPMAILRMSARHARRLWLHLLLEAWRLAPFGYYFYRVAQYPQNCHWPALGWHLEPLVHHNRMC